MQQQEEMGAQRKIALSNFSKMQFRPGSKHVSVWVEAMILPSRSQFWHVIW
jgi:hypothetical protein